MKTLKTRDLTHDELDKLNNDKIIIAEFKKIKIENETAKNWVYLKNFKFIEIFQKKQQISNYRINSTIVIKQIFSKIDIGLSESLKS